MPDEASSSERGGRGAAETIFSTFSTGNASLVVDCVGAISLRGIVHHYESVAAVAVLPACRAGSRPNPAERSFSQ